MVVKGGKAVEEGERGEEEEEEVSAKAEARLGADEEKYTEEAVRRWRRAAEAAEGEGLAVKLDGSWTPTTAARDRRFNKSLGELGPPPKGAQGGPTKVERRCRCMGGN
jgi:hypothetical protein